MAPKRLSATRRALALATFFAVGSCQGSPGGGEPSGLAPAAQQVLRINDGTEPSSYDPTQMTYVYEAAIGRQVFEALLKPKPDLSDVEPAGAASYEVSGDGLTYTFHLRPNARWSDGRPVRASDWIYGYQHLLNPALAAGYADPFFDGTIAGAQAYASVDVRSAAAIDRYLAGLGLSAPDSHTFVVSLQKPAAYFKWVVSLIVAIPLRRDVVERAAGGPFVSSDTTRAERWANDAGNIVGNGPFKIAEMAYQDHVTMVRNVDYWAGAPRLQRLVFEFDAAATALAKYRTAALDIVPVQAADAAWIRNDPTLRTQLNGGSLGLTTGWIAFNTHRPPLDNKYVRLALAKSIDRNELVNDVLHGAASATETFIPRGMTGYDGSDKAQSFDPAAARQLLKQSGVDASQLNQLALLTRSTTAAKTFNQFIADQWRLNLGLNIQLAVVNSRTVTAFIRKGQFDIYGPDGWAADYPDPQDWYDIFVSGACHALNWGCLYLPGYDSLVSRADEENDPSKRLHDYATAQRMLIDNAVVAFLDQPKGFALIAPYLHLTVTAIDEMPGDLNYVTAYVTQPRDRSS